MAAKGNVKVLLQTYFGDVRDCYSEITALNFDGIGLDFTEGKQTMALEQKNGFPKEKILFAGVVNGKNIWRNSYEKTLKILEQLRPVCGDIVLNTSCSLLHVPYTLRNETKLAESYQKHFAFAEEKLEELARGLNATGLELPLPSPAKSVKSADWLPGLLNAARNRNDLRPEQIFLVNRLCLRAMMQARYDPEEDGHFGLASRCYCHPPLCRPDHAPRAQICART